MSKNNIPHWEIIDDCEHFIAKCSNCGKTADSRLLPNKCPKCSATMKNSGGITMKDSLKPCPFCGSSNLKQSVDMMWEMSTYYIKCLDCGGKMVGRCIDPYHYSSDEKQQFIDEVIAKWNGRADK